MMMAGCKMMYLSISITDVVYFRF